jgi:hypothetical protein
MDSTLNLGWRCSCVTKAVDHGLNFSFISPFPEWLSDLSSSYFISIGGVRGGWLFIFPEVKSGGV